MSAICPIYDHNGEALNLVCTNTKCKDNRLLCSCCLESAHKNCKENIVEIDNIYKQNFINNTNWISNPEVKKAVELLIKSGLKNGKDQLLQIYEENISKEFDDLIDFFKQKVQETKNSMLKNARDLYAQTNINIEDFQTQLGRIYDFNSLSEVLKSFEQSASHDLSKLNHELDALFQGVNRKERSTANLEEIAKNINGFTKHYLEVEPKPFEELKQSLKFDRFLGGPFRVWTWYPNLKSSSLSLDRSNMIVQKKEHSLKYNTAVIGSLALYKDKHTWEIEVKSGSLDHSWVCFGVIETRLVREITDFPYCEAFALDTYGRVHNMNNEGLLANYDNKTYLCELDMEEGTFTISYNRTVIAKQTKKIKNNKVVPFAVLGEPGNCVRLHVLKCVEI